MMKRHSYFSALVATLLGACILNAAHGDTKELVTAGKISWEGEPAVSWIGDGESQLLLKFTDTTPGACSFKLAEGIKAQVRVVAVGGGGAGGVSHGDNIGAGGGGAGALIDSSLVLDGVSGGTSWAVTVGAGGACPTAYTTQVVGNNGNPSSFGSLVVAAGGGGGGAGTVGNDGGCGGGGSKGAAAYVGGTGSVGFDGGKGSGAKYGAGGGGMGGAGKASTTVAAGGGGDGVLNDITGDDLYYCGGGGGGKMAASGSGKTGGSGVGGVGGAADVAGPGVDGTGSGGGGSSSLESDFGGKGGDGVVFVLVLEAVDVAVAKPVIEDVSYSGENTAPFDFGLAYQYVSGVTNATVVGDYSFVVKPKDGFQWKDDGTTSNFTVNWKIVPLKINRPMSPVGLVYNGEEQVAAYDKPYYVFAAGSVVKATDAGVYSFTAVLNDKTNTCWDDGSTADLKVDWVIAAKAVSRPSVPSDLEYSGTNSVAFQPGEGYVYVSGETNSVNAGSFKYSVKLVNPANATNYVWAGESIPAALAEITNEWNIASKKVDRPAAFTNLVYNGAVQNAYAKLEDEYYTVLGSTNATAAGKYDVTFTLKNEAAQNYAWNVTPPTAENDWFTDWSIAKATNAIINLQMVGWKLGTTPSSPSCDALWGKDTVEYAYSQNLEAGPWESAAALTNGGVWYVRAVVPESANWLAATNFTEFTLWDNPANIFINSVVIKIPGVGEPRPIHQALIRLSPALLDGFDYEAAGTDGKSLAFIDGNGDLMHYEVDTWNVNGESLLWLRLDDFPADGTTVTLYWGLRPRQSAPAYDCSDVWENYAGVWHMSETSGKAINAAPSGSAYDGVPSGTYAQQMVGAPGKIGTSRVNLVGREEKAGSNGTRMLIPNYDDLHLGGVFTISGWFKAQARSGYPRPFSRKNAYNDGNGWEIQVNNSDTQLQTRGSKDTAISYSLPYKIYDDWWLLTMVFSNNTAIAYINGEQQVKGTIVAATDNGKPMAIGNNSNGSEQAFRGWYDEVRLYPGAMTAAMIAADYAMVTGTVSNEFGLVSHDGKKRNYWIKEPMISPTSWDVSSGEHGELIEPGQLAEGTITNYYYDIYAPTNVYSDISQITEPGNYRAVFMQKETEGYEPISKIIDIRILSSEPYVDIRGTDGDSGRVLLMNNDKIKYGTTSLQINYQGYADTAVTRSTYWDIPNEEGEEKQGSKSDLKQSGVAKPADVNCADFNIKVGRSSTLMKKDGSRLWHLEDCRHGNSYVFDPGGGTLLENYKLNDKQNYLPFSATSYDITALLTRNAKAGRATAGQIVMRNRTTAAVYSPCFTNGFGTLYFDAVNGRAKDGVGTPKDGSGYIIAVQWATNAVNTAGDSLPALDENCYSVGEDGVTNWYSRVEWHDAEMISYKRDGTPEFSEPVRSTELPLAVVTGGSDQNFYRIAVPLNFDVPARIRIVRRSVDAEFRTADSDDKTTTTVGYDNGGFVLLDNVIVSYPPMWAEMQPISKLDTSRHGKQAIGYEISTTIPYPAVGEANAFMRAKPVVHVNDGNKDIRPENFVASVKAHYRWRYLNQQFGEWKELDVNPTAEYTSVTPLEIPDEPGDIEYWLECGLEAPFYSYVDYTGLNIGIPYSEEIRAVTNHLGGAEIASGGTDWFFRLRDGKSDRQGVKVAVEGALKGEYELSLIGDSLWRGFIPNPTNVDGNCTFKFVGYNLQTPGSVEYATNTVVWGVNGGFTIKETPAAGTLEIGGDDIAFTVNHLANYYEVQFNEQTLSWAFGSAEYQDFNQWTDAKGNKFVGSSAMGNRKGTAPTKKTYIEDFKNWAAMDAENKNWTLFSFTDLNHLEGRTAYKQQASDTDEAWSIGPGMWVAKHYADQSANADTAGVAYQLKGCGEGYVQYVEKDNCPRGVESISFNARLGQYINFTDFSFYDGDQKSKMTNYVFTTRGSFDWSENKSFAGNASLSAVAYYRENKGCYEVRWEQVKGHWTAKASAGGTCDGIDSWGQRLRLYRWYRDPNSGKVESTLLGTWDNANNKVKVASCKTYMQNSASAQPLMISVETTPSGTRIVAGVATAGTFGETTNEGSRSWYGFCYLDTDKKRLTSGTYGLLSANCPGQFSIATSFKYAGPVTWSGDKGFADKDIGKTFGPKVLEFPTDTPKNCKKDFDDDYWIVTPGRMKYDSAESGSEVKGYLVASPAPQQLNVWTAPAGTMNWSLLKTIEVGSSFGAPAKPFDIKLYSTADCSVKISTGGQFDDPRNDVILDTVVVRQFRGNDYADSKEMTEPVPSPTGVQRIPGWNNPKEIHGMTNFIFTSAWIDNNAKRESGRILLSAKRTKKDKISGIRSPLLDGYYGRGRGLGMFAFDYADAQPNARLIVQIATNDVTYTDLPNYDDILAEGFWIDVETIDFATKPKSGTISYYFGIHDRPSAVRVIVDPARVESLASTTDPTKFGEIYITKVMVRDEPAINDGCWTGWNLRMIASDVTGDTEKRMYLPDYADLLEYRGLSAALNNSVTDGVDDPNDLTYRQNVPFVQTPVFGEGIVGEVSFKARTYGQNAEQPANVRIYGSKVGGDMAIGWEVVGDVEITNDVFTAYSFRVDTSKEFRAFRLGVTGALGVEPPGPGPVKPDGWDRSVRVLLDEVVVSQAVQARVGFRRVGAFKSDIIGTEIVPNVPSRDEQPLAMESWGVQCEIYGAQQPDSIDFTHTPTVTLHWYTGNYPWGYDRWKDLPGAKSAYMRLATDSGVSNWVYRSSQRACPDAVIPMATESPTFVQYTLEVVFYTKDGDAPKTNWLTRAEWERPEWYDPVDFNADYPDFAAFNILDNVAPGWAWINELNIFGEFDLNLNNSDSGKQFIEIAQPPEAELYDWEVRLLEPQDGNDLVLTNVLAVFGRNGFAAKKDAKYIEPTANMVFRTLANRAARDSGYVKTEDGTLDAVWKVDYPTSLFSDDGVITAMYPFALQLVRSSGVVEHEIVVMGTNWWSDLPAAYRDRYHPTNTVKYLDSKMRNADFLYIGKDDDAGLDRSLSVTNGNGSAAEQWTNLTVPTPGRLNQWQYINPDHPIPSGENIIIYATVSGDYIVQRGEDGSFTDQMQMLTVRKGSLAGTNLLYRVDPWYVLGSITTNDVSAAGGVVRQGSTQPKFYEIKVGVGCSNNVVVVAEAAPDPDFASKYGLAENDPYRPAVLAWLRNSSTARGPWENVEDGNIYLADFITVNGTVTQQLSLKEMYYLDMDPTVTNQALIGGISEAPSPHYTTNGGEAVTNVRYGVYMMFTNRTEDVADTAHYGKHWTPYVLRGLEPGSLSSEYDADKDRWNGPTFKATGIMLNGKTSVTNPDNWMPLRYFVFKDDSFTPEGTAQLEIEDPYWHGSIGYNTGWGAYLEEYGWQMIGYFWSLDTRIRPAKIETLKTVNYYDE